MSETVQVEIILYGSFFVYLFPNLEKLGIDPFVERFTNFVSLNLHNNLMRYVRLSAVID